MHPPKFWNKPTPSLPVTLLSPFAYLVEYLSRHRLRHIGWQSPVPVICCGNLTVGGTGKTIVASELGQFCLQQGIKVAFLTRGYGRKVKDATPILVNTHNHSVHDVGDEALLLAKIAPTWVASNRAISAQAAIRNGAQLLILDDGFQNSSLKQDLPLLIIDGVTGFGNGYVLPAGPLRQSISDGLMKAKACILIGSDHHNLMKTFPKDLPCFQAFLEMDPAIRQFEKQPIIAFAGIGRPEKFFDSLRKEHLNLLKSFAFPDHYLYRQKDLVDLITCSKKQKAVLVTTPKDYMRIPDSLKPSIHPLQVHLRWETPSAPKTLLNLLNSKPVLDVKE